MAHVAAVVPEENDLLCEACGYTLKGLPTTSNCPECGTPIEQSIGTHRSYSAFEDSPGLRTFIQTTAFTIFRPKRFFKSMITRGWSTGAVNFARLHLLIASVLFTLAAIGHLRWVTRIYDFPTAPLTYALAALIGIPWTYFLLRGMMSLAAWLTAIEARFWGMRLPYGVVMRGLQFHAAHYLPVGIVAVSIVWGFRLLSSWGIVNDIASDAYIYTLCIAVVVSAVYLFQTYWIAMRSMRYANR